MPNSKEHKKKADHNKTFLATVDINKFRDWAIVAAFYCAVHLVERLRTRLSSSSNQHSKDHQDRLQFVRNHHWKIHSEFHALYNASIISRYNTQQKVEKHFSVKAVKQNIIEDCLEKIEEHVDGVFASKG